MIDEVGWVYTILIVMLYIVVIIDLIAIIMVFRKDKADRSEYCTFGIKWSKIIVGLFFAVMLTYFIMVQSFTPYVMWVQAILAMLLYVIELFNIIIKVKYGKKRR
ncbi:MAG: hypothetical protein IJF18_03865 [Oscillospiraceae bacterium]|nr:hypothetical protein [Oscillospiraceae bacterium]